MRHISREELIETINNPTYLTADQNKHLYSCPVCTEELNTLKQLMAEIASFPEPEIDTSRMEELAKSIEDRISAVKHPPGISMTRHRKVPKWAVAIVLPIAAAALLFLLPQIEQWSQSPSLSSSQESDTTELYQYQWQLIWDGLMDDMDEISLLNDVSPEFEDPVADLQQLSNNELERFLNLLEETEIG